MAEKKTEKVIETPMQTEDKKTEIIAPVQMGFSVEQFAEMKAMLKAEVMAEMKAEEAVRTATLDAKEKEKEAMADLKLAEDEKNMKARLLAQPKKAIFIPEDGNETPYPIVWQGVICSVKKGELVEVPVSIAEIWEESYAATRKANAKIKINEIPSLTISE